MSTPGQIITGRMDFDVDARLRDVTEGGPRYAPLTVEEMSDEAKATIQEIRTMFHVPENRPMPQITLIQLNHLGLFRAHMNMGIEVAGKSDIPAHERELVIMRVAWLTRTPFEWAEHAVIGKRFGLTSEEMDRVTQGSSAPGWTEHQAAVLRATEELIGDHRITDHTWEVLAKSWNDKALMELPMLVGHYVLTAYQINSLKIPMEPGKTGFRDR